MKLTRKEKFNIKYLLPVQGSIETLKTVRDIADTIRIEPDDENSEEEIEIHLKKEEWEFLKNMILILDKSQKIYITSLSLVLKILNN